jgi:hypothetical protein
MKQQSQTGSEITQKGLDDALNSGRSVFTEGTDASEHLISTIAKKFKVNELDTSESNDDWSEAPEEPQDREPLPDITIKNIPLMLQQLVLDCSENLQVPLLYMSAVLVASFGAIIGSAIRLRPKKNDKTWAVVPNGWCVLVGSPSAKKSPTLEYGLKPLRIVDRYEKEQYENLMRAWLPTEASLNAQKEGVLDAIKQKAKGGKSGEPIDVESLEEKLKEIELELSKKPQRVVLYTNDSTQEAMLGLEAGTKMGTALIRDELSGFVNKMEGNNVKLHDLLSRDSYFKLDTSILDTLRV